VAWTTALNKESSRRAGSAAFKCISEENYVTLFHIIHTTFWEPGTGCLLGIRGERRDVAIDTYADTNAQDCRPVRSTV